MGLYVFVLGYFVSLCLHNTWSFLPSYCFKNFKGTLKTSKIFSKMFNVVLIVAQITPN